MYIKLESFLINENIKQMREYLRANGLENMESSLEFIKDKFAKKPNYISIFTKIMVSKDGKLHGTVQQFNDVADWVIHRNHLVTKLPKKINEYESIEELQDDIKRVNLKELTSKYYHSLYADMREKVEQLPISEREQMDTVTASFMMLDEDLRKSFPPLLYFKANHLSLYDLKSAMENFIESGEVNSTKKGVLSVVQKSNKANIVYDKENVLIIQSNDRDIITKLGSNRWCIVYAPDSYFDNYVGGEDLYAQFICFNFNLPQSNKYSLFGISLDVNNKAIRGGCQDRENNETSIAKISELMKVNNGIFTNPFLDVMRELLKSNDHILKILSMDKKYDIDTIIAICNKDQIKLGTIDQIRQNLYKTSPDLFGEAFSLYEYLVSLNLDLSSNSEQLPLYIQILTLIQIATNDTKIGKEEFSKYLNEYLNDEVKKEIITELIPDDYYDYPGNYQEYANTVELFNIDDLYDFTAFNYIIYEHSADDSNNKKQYLEKLRKSFNLDKNNIATWVISDYGDLEFLFDEDLDILDNDNYFDNYGTDNWEYVNNFSAQTILSLYEKLQEDGVELEHIDIYENIKNSELNKSNYTNTRLLYKDNDDFIQGINILEKYIVDIIKNPDEYDAEYCVDEIKECFNDAYNSAYNSALESELYNNFENALGEIFKYQKYNEKDVIFTFDENNNRILKLDIFKFINDNFSNLSYLVSDYGEDFDVKDVLKCYVDEHSQLTFTIPEYVSIDDDYINELINDEL